MNVPAASPVPALAPPGGTAPQPRPGIAALPSYSRSAAKSRVRWIASSNETPAPPSPAVQAAITAAGAGANRYPSLAGDQLVAAVAARLGLDAGQVVAGAGSLALLQLLLTVYTGPGDEVVYAWRSYEAYPILTGVAGATAVEIPLAPGARHDLPAMAAALTPAARAVIVCSPNNPTGTVVRHDDLLRFLQQVPPHVLVILDEAYREFARPEHDAAALLADHPNLVILRTFSKAYGLAGLRAGYLAASADIAGMLRRAAPPFPLSLVTEAAAVAAWAEPARTARMVAGIVAERDRLAGELRHRGIPVPPSGGNFLWIPAGELALDLEAACLTHSVSVRAFAGDGVRVTIVGREASTAVLAAVDAVPGLAFPDLDRRPAAAGTE
ncbi:histidinol-phosphate transaminase [Arthrobacter sp. I2-34]|uniref:Histidinol-phosphate transaminase n=1 Tax=Arthrobacter hankyongi TaxID=2904801 RepID=A0ABS9L740_9MICC|nr:histidinol-phosphate transaminase [Arthrobacter hankyongi]MCG2622489.1 histidinol-phosphate transaminase [Arthrobacter hankyongi]